MKLTIDLPDDTLCAFISYVYHSPENGLNMAVAQIDTDTIIKSRSGEMINIPMNGDTKGVDEVRE